MKRCTPKGFTLIELLTVITVIIILTALVLSVAKFAQTKAATSRAQSEIAALSSALESYKSDNGTYPDDGTTTSGTYVKGFTDNLNAQTSSDPTQSVYINAGLVLYRALSGDRNLDGVNDSNTIATSQDVKYTISGGAQTPALTSALTVYYPFKPNQLIMSGATVTSLADPFGYSYGYSTAYQGQVNLTGSSGTTNGYNPTYDLWSTRGTISGTSAVWITNW